MTESASVQGEIKRLESAGDYLQAYDRARQAIKSAPGDRHLHYLAVRSLARSGAARQAIDLYGRFQLGERDDLDCLALRGRLEKDLALGLAGPARTAHLRKAAALYEQIHRRLGGYYPAINAATLYLLAGEKRRAHGYAQETLAYCARDAEKGELDDYYRIASEAEAHLVLGETIEAMHSLHKLASISRDDLAARASTRRQLRLILDAENLNDSILDPLTPPDVIHYTGHAIGPGGLSAGAEAPLAHAIAAALSEGRIGIAYGSLAAGSDILFAEQCLARRIELHLVFPFGVTEFKSVAVRPAGDSWVARFNAILPHAASTTFATESDHLGDDSLFAYCGELAMGKAILRGRYIDAKVAQIAVWDGRPGDSGVAADVARWRSGRHESRVIQVNAKGGDRGGAPAAPRRLRELRPLMFGDTVGFSRLGERLLQQYRKSFFGTIAATLTSYGNEVLTKNSWGDAVYLVMADAARAARCALDMQRRLAALDHVALGFEHPLKLRLSLHYGPIFPGIDELTGASTYFGREVTFAARMEPVTPPGEVYATEELASQLALSGETAVAADYVGTVELAKQYGTAPMYLLRRAQTAEDSDINETRST